MPRIHLLDEKLSNQIAAGEVIERPAAVVKELVENALDAGARRIEIDLLEGGRKLVRVRDDGMGMERADARLSLSRHATSKLRDKEGLFAIHSYGFRGEALPSIAAVSRFAMLTAEESALAGTRIEVDGGTVTLVEDAGHPRGTTIEVRDLFWNVPARRKFVKRAATEQAHALEAVLRLALPRLEVHFSLREGERLLLQLTSGQSLETRAEEALGRELRGRWTPFDASVRGIQAKGLAGSPDVSHGSAKAVWLFVNGRAVRDRQLTHAALRAYGEVLPHGRFPAVIIFLEVPPAEVDVNVHPAKAEVRLADARAAYEAIHRGLASILAPGTWLGSSAEAERSAGLGAQWSAGLGGIERRQASGPPSSIDQMPATRAYALDPSGSSNGEARESAFKEAQALRVGEAIARFGARPQREERAWQPFAPSGAQPSRPANGSAEHAAQEDLIAPAPFFAGLRYLGQLHRTYLVCEGPRGLVLIDQHAAHERMNYQRLRKSSDTSQNIQPLLVPRVLSPSPHAGAQLAGAIDALAASGIELAEFGAGTFAIRALPRELAHLADAQLLALLADLADEVEAHGKGELETHGKGESLQTLRDALLARAACHASVRAHDPLSPGEAQALLDALDATDYGARCAHGRPVVAEWNLPEIEKRFGRDYASHSHAHPPEAL